MRHAVKPTRTGSSRWPASRALFAIMASLALVAGGATTASAVNDTSVDEDVLDKYIAELEDRGVDVNAPNERSIQTQRSKDDGLAVTHTAKGYFDRDYDWDITKTVVGDDSVTVPAGTETVDFDYDVVATATGANDNFKVKGWVTVQNTSWLPMLNVKVTDDECGLDERIRLLLPGQSRTFKYNCDELSGEEFTNTATAKVTFLGHTIAKGRDSATPNFEPRKVTNNKVIIKDSHHTFEDPVLKATKPVHTFDFDYSVAWDVPEAGECTSEKNTASLHAAKKKGKGWKAKERVDKNSAWVEICAEADLIVVTNPTATFDRLYEWDIDKSVTTDSEIDKDGQATFDYTVAAIPGEFGDSNWNLTGEITVTNPNTFGEITFDVGATTTVSDECIVAGGEDVTLAGGGTETFTYGCVFTEQPEYEGTSTATASWIDAAGEDAQASDSEDFTFEVDGETDKVVEVWDDQTDPDNPVSLGEATWNADGEATTFEYSLVHQGVEGETTEFTNTAWIEVTGENPEASTTVDVTIDPAKPDAKPSLPDTGAPIAGLAALALLLTVGGGLFLTKRRRSEG